MDSYPNSSEAAAYQAPVDAAMLLEDDNYGYEQRIGLANNEFPEQFASPVQSWDVHVYFDSKSSQSTKFALNLRYDIMQQFPDLTVNRPYRNSIGPHPCAMWSCELHSPGQFVRFLPWFCTRHGELSALIHPNTNNALKDHTVNCFWIGEPVVLNVDIFRNP